MTALLYVKFRHYLYPNLFLFTNVDDDSPFPLAISGTSYGYKKTDGTFVAFRSDSTGTYTFPVNSTGSTVDLGAKNTYRYVNATNVYEKGKSDKIGGISGTLEVSAIQFYSINCGGTPKVFMIWKWSGNYYYYMYTYGYPNSNTIQGRVIDAGSANYGLQVNGTPGNEISGLGTINITSTGLEFKPANSYGYGTYLYIVIL